MDPPPHTRPPGYNEVPGAAMEPPRHRRPPGYKEGRDWQWRCLLGTVIGGVAGTVGTSATAAVELMGAVQGNELGAMVVNATLACVAGAVGTSATAAVGLMGSMRGNALGAMAVNATLASACLAGSEELVRELRSSDAEDATNAVIGGAISGYSLGMIRGGRALAPAATVAFAIFGLGLHEAVGSVQAWRLRQMLSGEDTALQDGGVEGRTRAGHGGAEKVPQGAGFELPKWFPIRPATPEELEKHEERMRRRRQALLEGDGDKGR